MAENTGQERTEQPTQKRLKESRDKGQVPRSRELNTMIMMVASALGMLALGGLMGENLTQLLTYDLHLDRQQMFHKGAIMEAFQVNVMGALKVLAPFLALMMLAAFMGPLLMGGWSFSGKAMAPKLSKLNPLKGLKRVFGIQGLVELLKALGKFLVLGTSAAILLGTLTERYTVLGQLPPMEGIQQGLQLIALVFLVLAVSLGLIAALDVPFQQWDHIRKLKMTRQEVKEETKETEGNPEVRGRIRRVQQELAQRRMLQDVPKADVVIVNPTHFSVALRYDEANEQAPRVLAKGADYLALKIREIAAAHDIPVYSAPPLARSLYHHAEIDEEIPAELYMAVAQILAYIYQVKQHKAGTHYPVQPDELPIPEAFRVKQKIGKA